MTLPCTVLGLLLSEQQQAAPATVLNNAQLSARLRATDKAIDEGQVNTANTATQVDQLTVVVEQLAYQVESTLDVVPCGSIAESG